ncbi:MAG TPA: hypothetical protein VHS06_02035 [Chloroflexota bacterium]|nr:hypothetical protein [Chloroflexota bacterium]
MDEVSASAIGYRDLIVFQLNNADHWLSRGQSSDDSFAQFFFYFAGFNALYFLWKIVDNLDARREGRRTPEIEQIDNLLSKLNDDEAARILSGASRSVAFFSKRPIQQMENRTPLVPGQGEQRKGIERCQQLGDTTATPVDRVTALGRILYLVRCNLVHGGKADRGDDEHVIEKAVPALKALLTASVELTRRKDR